MQQFRKSSETFGRISNIDLDSSMMRQSRALKAPVHDVCVFCAYRAISFPRASIPQRRYLSTSAQYRRQQAGVSFQESDEGGGWGGLAQEVETPLPQPSPVPEQEPEQQQQNPTIRSRHLGRDIPLPSSRNKAFTRAGLREQPQAATSGFRIRKVQHLQDARSSPEANISADLASRWTFGRRPQVAQQTTHSSTSPQDTSSSTQHYTSPIRSTNPSFTPTRTRSPLEPGSWSQALAGKASYVPLDARFSGASSERVLEGEGRVIRPNARTARSSLQSLRPEEKLGWQANPLSNSKSSNHQPRWNSGPRDDTIHGVRKLASTSQAPQEAFDEYGLPIASKVRRSADESKSVRQASTAISYNSEARIRRDKDRKFGKHRLDEDQTSRRDDKKKGLRINRREVRDDDFDVDEYHRRKRERQAARTAGKATSKAKSEGRIIHLPDFIRIGSLATELDLRYSRFAEILQKFGFEDVNSDFVLSAENAALIVEEAGFTAVTESNEPDKDLYAAPLPEDISLLPSRPPVVTIMGHVDHGKTTILDYMRKSSIVSSEHGGITQHIGAFSVPMPSGKTITFLDTPGHAAFLSMRQRGANVTDIVVLVVAADDSVMPQTLEALKHARTANVPIIVALSKIDKPEARPDQVKQDLARHGVEIEDYGGDVQVVEVSGKTGKGMPDLEEAIVALSEIQDQRAPVNGAVEGWVLESSTKEVGKVATVLIRRGTLQLGDIIVAGTEYCRVRTMRDEFGMQITEVGPGMPAEIDGWRGQPSAGDEVLQAPSEQIAHDVTDLREAKLKRAGLGKDVEAINEMRKAHQLRHEREKAIERARKGGIELPEDATRTMDDDVGITNVYFIVKGDVAGSVEAVVNAISTLGNSEVQPVILKAAVGTVSESDVDHATAAGGHVISFNTSIAPTMRAMAERAGTKILDHNIIYRLVDDVKSSLEDVLPPIVKSRVLGEAQIAQVFEVSVKRKKVKIAGCKVRNGNILRNSKVRVVRGFDNEVVYTGSLTSLKNVKKDVMEMSKGTECGMGFEDWQDFEIGDIAQCFEEWEERRTL